jgi:hypothetical protein
MLLVIYCGLAASVPMIVLVVGAGVVLPTVWSRHPERRRDARRTLRLLLAERPQRPGRDRSRQRKGEL